MNEKMLIPVSILIAGLLVGTGIYFATSDKPTPANNPIVKKTEKNPIAVNTATDHITGNKEAKIFVVEYSDLECPFCKKYNDRSSEKLIEKYAKGGKVAFVFRHMPLSSRHPSAFGEAVATECAGNLGGNEKFFEYKSKIFSETKSDGKFDSTRLPEIAMELEINKTAFETCLKDKTVAEKVTASFNEAVSAGVQGTPTVFIQLQDGQTYPVPADFEIIDKSLQAYLNQ